MSGASAAAFLTHLSAGHKLAIPDLGPVLHKEDGAVGHLTGAASGPEFDRLTRERRREAPPREVELAQENYRQVITKHLDHSYVSLRFKVGRLLGGVAELRPDARGEQGWGSAEELG